MRNKRLQGRLLKANQTLTPRVHYEPIYDKDKVVAVARKFGLTTITGVSPIWTEQSEVLSDLNFSLFLSYSSLESYDSNTKVVAVLSSIELVATVNSTNFYVRYSLDGGSNWVNAFPGYISIGTIVPVRLVITPNVDDSITICIDGETDVSTTIVGLAGKTGNIIKITPASAYPISTTVNFRHYVINYE